MWPTLSLASCTVEWVTRQQEKKMTRMRAGTMSYRLCHISDASYSICAARVRRLFAYPCNACFRYVYRIRTRGNIELKTSRYTSRPLMVLDARIRKIASLPRRQLGLALPQSRLRTLLHPHAFTIPIVSNPIVCTITITGSALRLLPWLYTSCYTWSLPSLSFFSISAIFASYTMLSVVLTNCVTISLASGT